MVRCQEVISQEIASSPNDSKLRDVVKLIFDIEDDPIVYNEVEHAIALVSNPSQIDTDIATGASILSALSMLGLSPAAAISAAVLGATISPWLIDSINEKD